MTFHVGQKVVCVKRGDWVDSLDVPNRPVTNGIYTVRAMADDGIGLYFEEIKNAPLNHIEGFYEPAWWKLHFRPIVERKTDISIFKQLLIPGTKIREDA